MQYTQFLQQFFSGFQPIYYSVINTYNILMNNYFFKTLIYLVIGLAIFHITIEIIRFIISLFYFNREIETKLDEADYIIFNNTLVDNRHIEEEYNWLIED